MFGFDLYREMKSCLGLWTVKSQTGGYRSKRLPFYEQLFDSRACKIWFEIIEWHRKYVFTLQPGLCLSMAWHHVVDEHLQSCHQFHSYMCEIFNSLRPRQNDHHIPDIFKCISLNENVSLLINIWLKFIPKGPINTVPALVQVMAWRRIGDKPLSEPMLT